VRVILLAMSEPIGEQSRPTRAAAVIGGLALAVFFGTLGVFILRAPINDPDITAWSGWALRAFVFLIFGAMAGLGLWSVHAGLRGPVTRRLPAPIRGRCPACGEAPPRGASSVETCAFCGRAPDVLARAWCETPREGLAGPLLVGAIGGALLSLGILLAAGALEQRESLLLVLAYGALALLLIAVGAAMLYGWALTLRDAFRQRGRRDLTLTVAEDGETITARATLARRAWALRGTTVRVRTPEELTDEVPHDLALPKQAATLARVLAVLHARGAATLTRVERRTWTLEDGGALLRESEVDVGVDASLAGEEEEEPMEARDRVLGAMAEGATARRLLARVRESEELRSAFQGYAEELPASEADPRVLRMLGAVLREGEAGAPYR
jgi:hypothetical protein